MTLRKIQLLSDYPEFVSKFSLLILSGLSISNALIRISNDYTEGCKKNKTKKFLYEELVITCSKIKNGMYEPFAYEQFGRRCALPCYIKFSSLLISGLKRGDKDFNRHLSEEVTTSLLEHKADILQQSNKASTKLIGPMLLIFAVILILVMVPAFMSMNI